MTLAGKSARLHGLALRLLVQLERTCPCLCGCIHTLSSSSLTIPASYPYLRHYNSFLFKIYLHHFMRMSISPACVYVHSLRAEDAGSPGPRAMNVVNHYVGIGN